MHLKRKHEKESKAGKIKLNHPVLPGIAKRVFLLYWRNISPSGKYF